MNSVIELEGCKIGTELCRAKPDWKTLSVSLSYPYHVLASSQRQSANHCLI